MIALAQQFIEKHCLIFIQDRVLYFKGTIFQGSTKPLFASKIGWRSAEKFSSFKLGSSSVAPRISMVVT
jgi:hypothetical protein